MEQRSITRQAPENARGIYRSEYEKLVEIGAFADQRVELLDGHVVEMSPQGDAHVTIVANLARRFFPFVPEFLRLRTHSGLRAGAMSMPEPDVAVVPHRDGFYQSENALLVIEVSDSSLHNDREVKSKIYAAVGVPEYWIVDVRHQLVLVHTDALDGTYQNVAAHVRGATLTPRAVPALALSVADILDAR